MPGNYSVEAHIVRDTRLKIQRGAVLNRFISISKFVKICLYALPLIYAMNGNALTLCVGSCPPDIPPPSSPLVGIDMPLPVLPMQPGFLQLIPTQNATGWQYGFVAPNSLYSVVSVTMPVFSDSLISGIAVPTDWSFSTGATDVFGLGTGAGYMSWVYNGVAEPSAYTSFSFQSEFGPSLAPFLFVQLSGTVVNDSGLFIPLSPLALAAGLQPYISPIISPVPEPETWILMSMGLLFGYLAKGRRRLA